jgi:LacI family transcriptional regulator
MKENVTLDDIAEALDINISTVSRALKNHPKISNATKKRVQKKAKELGYAANNIATALARGRSNVVGIIVPSVDENFFSKAIRGIEIMLKKNGYRVIISQSHDTIEDEKSCIKTLLEARVDGILASHAMQTKNFAHYQQVIDRGITLILFDRFNEILDTHVVAIDDFKGAYRTTEHLIEQGCQKIAYIGGFSHVHIYNERFKGYRKALSDHNLEFNETMVREGDMKADTARRYTEELLQDSTSPDAIFATSDYSAMGAIQVLKEHDISIPEQVAVAGFSNEDFSSFVTPTLTSTEQHSNEMGRLAAQLFLNQVDDDGSAKISQKTMLATELIIRESSLRNRS